MKTRKSMFVLALVAALVASLPDAAAAEARRYARWEGATIPFAVDEAFLAAQRWDLRQVDFGSASLLELAALDADETGEDRTRIGLGILLTPAGEFPTVLYRETVLLPDDRIAVQYRWIGLGRTTLAVVRGPLGPDLETFPASTLVARLEAGAPEAGMRIYHDELGPGVLSVPGGIGAGINYNFDASPNTDPAVTILLSSLTTQGYANGAAITSATVWDFTPVSALANNVIAQTDVPVNAGETCEAARCGFNLPGIDFMSRQDNLTSGVKTVAAFEEMVLCDGGTNNKLPCNVADLNSCPGGTCVPRVWLRAGAQKEGGPQENRFCYDGQNDANGVNRGQVRQWSFAHPDGAGRAFLQVGDVWTGDNFSCTINLFQQNCGVAWDFLTPTEVKTSPCSTHTGRFQTEVLSEGSVKLPSGHWVDVIVMQQLADFCVFLPSSNCSSFDVQRVKQPVVLFAAPFEGTVAQVNGNLVAPSPTTWTGVNETLVRFGLLPPLSIQVDGVTDTSVTLSWNPGNQFGFIDRAKVYWDVHTCDTTTYDFNSDTHPGQVVFGPNGPGGFPLSATITGLDPASQYFFTVTFLDNFTEPDATPFAYEYESNLYPNTIQGTVDGLPGGEIEYPVEVTAMTTSPGCAPTTAVTNLMLAHSGANVQFSWDAVTDPCFDHYILLGSDDAPEECTFTAVANPGMMTNFTGNPDVGYYLVVAAGAGGEFGPLGP